LSKREELYRKIPRTVGTTTAEEKNTIEARKKVKTLKKDSLKVVDFMIMEFQYNLIINKHKRSSH